MAISETDVTANRSEKVNFQWILNRSGYEHVIFGLYRGDSANTEKKLLTGGEDPTNTSLHLFGQRLLKAKYKKTILEKTSYEVTITNLQYADSGSFYAEFVFADNKKKTVTLNITVNLDVIGMEYGIYSL